MARQPIQKNHEDLRYGLLIARQALLETYRENGWCHADADDFARLGCNAIESGVLAVINVLRASDNYDRLSADVYDIIGASFAEQAEAMRDEFSRVVGNA